jgi:hypothetical protein
MNSIKNTFGNIKETQYSGDYTKKKGKGCIPSINKSFNSANLYVNLYKKEDLSGVTVIESAYNPTGVIIPSSLPFYEKIIIDPCGQLFGNTYCGINNYTKYMVGSLQTDMVNEFIEPIH